MEHDFLIANTDTDSISFGKKDGTPFSPEEVSSLVAEINNISPDKMLWENDGYYEKFVVLAAKNYILWDGKKLKLKGSSLKDAKSEKALKEFQQEIIQSIIHDRNDFKEIYLKYIKEALSIKDINRWASKKTLSKTTYESDRTNETKIIDAIVGTEYVEGDRIWVYFKEDSSLGLVEHYDGKYHVDKMLKKVFNKSSVFDSVLNTKELFLNYSLKKNKKLLENEKEILRPSP